MHNNNESNIKFSDLAFLFISKLWIMILVAVVVGGSLFAYKYVTYEPKYKSTSSVFVLRQGEDTTVDGYSVDVNIALKVVEDCKELLTTPKVLNSVIEKLKLPYSYDELKSIVEVSSKEESRLIEISVTTNNPQTSKMIADAICEQGDIVIDDTYKCDQITPYDNGTLNKTPVNSRFSIAAVLIAFAVFVLTYIVFVLIYIFDDRISDPEHVEKILGLPVLAQVPNMKKEKANDIYYGKTAVQRHRYYSKHMKGNK